MGKSWTFASLPVPFELPTSRFSANRCAAPLNVGVGSVDKRRVQILDDDGEPISTFYFPAGSEDLEDGDMSGLNAYGCSTLRGRSLQRSSLYWANLQGADLSGCNMRDCDLRGAVLRDAKLCDADLAGADLGKDNVGGATDMHGADFSGAIVLGSNLAGAEYDDSTVFPAGFDPQLHGMVKTT